MPSQSTRLIFITIENYNREFKGKYILATQLSSMGFSVLLGHKSLIRKFASLPLFRGSIFIEKGLKNGSFPFLSRLRDNDIKIYTFDEEALMQTDFSTYLRLNHEASVRHLLSGVFSWGPMHSNLLQYAGYNQSQILRTGNPRFDNFIISSSQPKSPSSPYILICSRFASANPASKGKSSRLPRDGSQKYIDDSLKVLQSLLKLPSHLRSVGISIPIIVRPHPSESHSLWLDATKDLDSVYVSSSGDISDILENACVVIHNRCTTGLQAFLSKTPVISYEPVQLDEPPNPPYELFKEFSNSICTSNHEVSDQIQSGIIFCSKSPQLSTSTESYLYNIHQGASYPIATHFISSDRRPFKSSFILISLFLFSSIRHFMVTIASYIYDTQGSLYKRRKTGFIPPRFPVKFTNSYLEIRLPFSTTYFRPSSMNS